MYDCGLLHRAVRKEYDTFHRTVGLAKRNSDRDGELGTWRTRHATNPTSTSASGTRPRRSGGATNVATIARRVRDRACARSLHPTWRWRRR